MQPLNYFAMQKMPLNFKDITGTPAPFFDLLPPEWQESIVPYWPSYQATSQIFVLENKSEIGCGGIVFSTLSPDTRTYQEEARRWFGQDYLYIGFLFVPEKHRGKHFGTAWLQALEKHFPGQAFWLSIDEIGLQNFYEKNGYRLVKQVEGEYGPEWILVKDAGPTAQPSQS